MPCVTATTRGRGFTLIELLVSIAIIALLSAILLPSLARARGIARQAACMAHMRGAAQAVLIYTAEHDGYLPGPNTSGAFLSAQSQPQPVMPGATPPNVPIANVDWISPSMGDTMGLPRDRVERLEAIFNTRLRCPSNTRFYDDQFPWASFSAEQIRSFSHASYAATLGFHVRAGSGKDLPGEDYVGIDDSPAGDYVQASSGYMPIIERVGRASQKVMLVEGTRYLSGGLLTFDARGRAFKGGNFMLYGPAVPMEGDPFYNVEDRQTYCYRHVGQKMNEAMFDGRVAPVAMDTDAALDIRRYFPDGFLVKDPGRDPNAQAGEQID